MKTTKQFLFTYEKLKTKRYCENAKGKIGVRRLQ